MVYQNLLASFMDHPFFKDLSEKHLLLLASGVRPFTAKEGEFLAKAGETTHALFAIQEGHVELSMPTKMEKEIYIQSIGPGEVVGWSWTTSPCQWTFNCRALDDVKGVAFDSAWLHQQCIEDTDLGFHLLNRLMGVLASRLNATRQQLAEMYR